MTSARKTTAALSFAIAFTVSLHAAALDQASETLKIMGGSSGIKLLQVKKEAMEKAVGGKIEFGDLTAIKSVVALGKGMIFAAAVSLSPESAVSGASQAGLHNAKVENFEWYEFASTPIKVIVHPENPVKALSKQQLTDILSGKVKNWNAVGGLDLPIRVISAREYAAINSAVGETFLAKSSYQADETVVNKEGLAKAVQANKGALTFHSTNIDTGFSLKYLDSDAAVRNYIVFKKPLSPQASKLLLFIKESKR